MFLAREFPTVTFERFADDAVVHCVTERQARQVQEALTERLAGLGLQLHPDKTKIVYCKDSMGLTPFGGHRVRRLVPSE
jgi:RNA-directed DNA polymerase